MTGRSAGFVLFAVAFVALPLPLLGIDGTLVPAARFTQLAAAMVGLTLVEGTGGMVGTLVGLFVGHALVYGLLLAGGCWALQRFVLRRMPAAGRRAVVVAVCVALLVLGSFGSLYDTPFHHRRAHATLLELYR